MNKQTYLQKVAPKKLYKIASKPYEFAHTTPYYFHKDEWPGPTKSPDKGPIRCLETYIEKHDRKKNLKIMVQKFPNISKWIMNLDIDNELSNKFWSNPTISYSQKIAYWTIHGQC